MQTTEGASTNCCAAQTSLEDVLCDMMWRIARVTQPEIVLKYDPRLSDEEAHDLAAGRKLWVVERNGTPVACVRQDDDGICWLQPELIEIAASPAAWGLLPLPVQQQIWAMLLGCLRGEETIIFDRPEILRLAESTFRAIMDRAVAQCNSRLIEDLVADCPYFEMGREDLLKQSAWDLRRWHRLLRLSKNVNVRDGIKDFVRALRHAAGLIFATDCEVEPLVEPNLLSDAMGR